MAEILFCTNSLGVAEDEVVEKVNLLLPDSEIEICGCLGHCGSCGDTPYALVNKEYLEAETHEELVNKIIEIAK